LSSSLDKLLENPRVWRGRNQAQRKAGLASGYPELDRHLPGGGWPTEALTEILTEQYGIGELRLLMPALARLSAEDAPSGQSEPGWIAWVAPPFQPYPPALQQCGIDLSRMLMVRPKGPSEGLWSAEQALCSGTCAIAFRPMIARQQPSAAALRLELHSSEQGTRVHILKSRGGRPTVLTKLL
jgi:cell division inhibitor SulA/protein ImuA